MALALVAVAAAAQEEPVPASEQSAQAGTRRPMLVLSSSQVPWFDNSDALTRASRTNLTLFPASRSAMGLSVGVTTSTGAAMTLGAPYVSSSGPMLDLGLHWRHEMDGTYRLDVTAWRRVGSADAISLVQSRDPDYGARVEMSFGGNKLSPRSAFVAERGFVGLQLDGGARVTVRRSGGRPMLYYRNTF